ncbi:MAG: hypothetical protein J6D54_01650 [Olsenella sp.]|nr:hypothetical protein [Olsenella sp.]
MAAHFANEWEHHQDGRDAAAGRGLLAITLVLVAIGLLVSLSVGCARAKDAKAGVADREPMDGSTAGANAVTLEDLGLDGARDEYLAGAWSVTAEDLAREYEMGQAYPLNGKDTPLTNDTTYAKGGGMVDMITYDLKTNVEIRHYGQLEPDGTVRWYAAETVLDEEGKPVVMPRN